MYTTTLTVMLTMYCGFWCVVFFIFIFKFYSHNCNFYITIQTIQIHIAATNYMSMFYLFFGIEKKEPILLHLGKHLFVQIISKEKWY